MQRTGTEWVFRLAQEPRRLFKRYAKDCCLFGSLFARQWWQFGIRIRHNKAHHGSCEVVQRAKLLQEISVHESLDAHAVERDRSDWESIAHSTGDILLNMEHVRYIDSTGVGLLVRLRKAAQSRERQLVLVAPSPAVRRALEAMWLWPFFLQAANSDKARQLLAERARLAPVVRRQDPAVSGECLEWQGEITAANATGVWELTQKYLEAVTGAVKTVQVQMSAVHFLDSTGLGLMVRAKKLAQERGLALGFSGVQANVRNVIRLARLEGYLLG
jgi:anti-anti-sigma factor